MFLNHGCSIRYANLSLHTLARKAGFGAKLPDEYLFISVLGINIFTALAVAPTGLEFYAILTHRALPCANADALSAR